MTGKHSNSHSHSKHKKKNKHPNKSSFWKSTSTGANYASYLRLTEIVNNFGMFSEQILKLLPESVWINGFYKGFTNIALPLAKIALTRQSLEGKDQTELDQALIKNSIDFIASGLSFLIWALKPTNDSNFALYAENTLLVLGLLTNLYKDLQQYRTSFKKELKADIEQPLQDKIQLLEQDVSELNEKIGEIIVKDKSVTPSKRYTLNV